MGYKLSLTQFKNGTNIFLYVINKRFGLIARAYKSNTQWLRRVNFLYFFRTIDLCFKNSKEKVKKGKIKF